MSLLEGALTEMGLSTSRRNCEFLLRELKGLSGRMAMRLAGPSTAAGELIALSLVSYINGYRPDVKAICDLAHAHGAYVYADVIQAAADRPNRHHPRHAAEAIGKTGGRAIRHWGGRRPDCRQFLK